MGVIQDALDNTGGDGKEGVEDILAGFGTVVSGTVVKVQARELDIWAYVEMYVNDIQGTGNYNPKNMGLVEYMVGATNVGEKGMSKVHNNEALELSVLQPDILCKGPKV